MDNQDDDLICEKIDLDIPVLLRRDSYNALIEILRDRLGKTCCRTDAAEDEKNRMQDVRELYELLLSAAIAALLKAYDMGMKSVIVEDAGRVRRELDSVANAVIRMRMRREALFCHEGGYDGKYN